MYFNFKLNIMKLIKGKKYLITGASDIKPDFVKKCEVKFPQTVLFNGEWLIVKDIDGFSGWSKEFFVLKCDRQATLEIYKTKKSRNMKLIKGKKYLIKGFKDKATGKLLSSYDVKFPQEALFDGEYFILQDNTGSYEYAVSHFDLNKVKLVKETRTATLEIYKTKKGLSYRKIASNGKVLNHQYNTMAGLNKGIEAEKRFWENYKVVTK